MEEIYKKTVNENGICFCNKEELNMTNPKDFDGERTEFTWIPFYEEIAKKLLEYKLLSEKYKTEFLAASDFVKPSETDQEHLDREAHKIFAEALYKKLTKIF